MYRLLVAEAEGASSSVLCYASPRQPAAALEVYANVPSLTLLSADANLNTAATGAGLLADDPNRRSHTEGIDFR